MILISVDEKWTFTISGHCEPHLCCGISSLVAAAETWGDVTTTGPGDAIIHGLPQELNEYILETMTLMSRRYPNEIQIEV
jgi:hypothetical protein